VRLSPLAAALLAMFWGGPVVYAVAGNTIVPTGATGTTLSVNGNATDIRTTTVHGANAFNTFSQFQVGAGNAVNLHLPSGTQTLVNLVTGSATQIDGSLTSLLSNGKVGGSVIFADPYGLVVGAGATINVGSLTVSTPSAAAMARLGNAAAGIDDGAVADLIAGNLPMADDARVIIRGRINALGGVTVHGGAGGIDVTGAIRVGAAGRAGVNAAGLAAVDLIEQDGKIVLTGGGDVHVSGALIADGDAWSKAGAVRVTAARDVVIDGAAALSASATSGDGAGGNVYVFGARNASVGALAKFAARASGSGDGGMIEVSAHDSVLLDGGVYDASSPFGKSGLFLVDPTDIVISGDVSSPGTPYVQSATKSFTLNQGVSISTVATAPANDRYSSPAVIISAPTMHINGTIDTRAAVPQGAGAGTISKAGDITLNGQDITISSSAKLLAGDGAPGATAGSYIGGTISVLATETNGSGVDDKGSHIVIDGATLNAKDIALEATSQRSYDFTGIDAADIQQGAANFAGTALAGQLAGVQVQVALSKATADIVVKGAAKLTATDSLSLKTGANAKTVTYSAVSPSNAAGGIVSAGMIYGETTSHSTIDIQDTSTLSAKDLVLDARNTAQLGLTVYAFSNGDSADAAVAVGRADVVSRAVINPGTTVNASNSVSVFAGNNDSFATSATSMALDAGAAGVAMAVFKGDTSATATIGAHLTTSDLANVTVQALDQTVKNYSAASATAGSGWLIKKLSGGPIAGGINNLSNSLLDDAFGLSAKLPSATSKPKAAGAVSWVDYQQAATAAIVAGTVVNATHDVVVDAKTVDQLVQNQASASVESQSKQPTAQNPAATIGTSFALSYGDYHHAATAYLGNATQITAQRVGVQSTVDVPYQETYSRWEGLTSITNKLNGTLGGANNLVSGFANSQAEADNVAIAGSVLYQGYSNDSNAYIGKNASVTLRPGASGAFAPVLAEGGVVSASDKTLRWSTSPRVFNDAANGGMLDVLANSNVSGVYVAGNFGILLFGTSGQPGGVSLGGSYAQIDYTTATHAWIAGGVTVSDGITMDSAVKVAAVADETLLAISPSAGKGGSAGLNGTIVQVKFNEDTQAAISNQATVTADSVGVSALDTPVVLAIAGALTSSDTVSVGIAVATVDIGSSARHLTTSAFIGDDDALLAAVDSAAASAVTAAHTKLFTVDHLDVEARNEAFIASVGVAGTVASNETQTGPRSDAVVGTATAAAKSAAPKAEPKFGLGISGAGVANTTFVDTSATIQDAAVTAASAGSSTVRVAAVKNSDVVAASGAAAMTSAKAQSSQGSGAVAGAFAENSNSGTTSASMSGAKLIDVHDVSVVALGAGEQIAIGMGASVTKKRSDADKPSTSIAGSVSLSSIDDDVTASIRNSDVTQSGGATAGAVSVDAYNRSQIGSGGGSLVFGGKVSVGGAITYSKINSDVSAYLDKAKVTGYHDVAVRAETAAQIATAAAIAAYSGEEGGLALTAALVLTEVNDGTGATIKGGSEVAATNAVTVTAKDSTGNSDFNNELNKHRPALMPADLVLDYSGAAAGLPASTGSSIISVAGEVSVSKSPNIGASFFRDVIANDFLASIEDSTVSAIGPAGKILVNARSGAGIFGLAIGVNVSTGTSFALGGSLAMSDIHNSVDAHISAAAHADSDPVRTITSASTEVSADDASTILSGAGAVTISTGQAAIGAAVGVSDIGNDVSAKIAGVDLAASATAKVSAANASTIQSLVISVGYGKDAAVNGAAVSSTIGNTTVADVSGARSSQKAASWTIEARDTSQIEALATAAAGSAKAAVGATVAVNRIGNTTSAHLTGGLAALGTNSYVLKDLQLTSVENEDIKTFAAAIAGGGEVGVAGSVATNLMKNNNSASIDNAVIDARNAVFVSAKSLDSIEVMAGAAGIGVGAGGVGLSVVVNEIRNDTSSFIDHSTVNAHGLQESSARLDTGELVTAIDVMSDIAPSVEQRDLGTKLAVSGLRGVGVEAVSGQSIITNAATIAGSSEVAVSLVPVVNIVGGTTSARITASQIDMGLTGDPGAPGYVAPDVAIAAYNHSYALNLVAAIGGGSFAGAGAASLTNFDRTTEAYSNGTTIGSLNQHVVRAAPVLTPTAGATDDTIVLNDPGAKNDPLPIPLPSYTTAVTTTLLPTVGAVKINAGATNQASSIVAGGAAGGVALAGSGIVDIFSSNTHAYLRGATVNANSLAVDAIARNDDNTIGGGIAMGLGAVAATFVVVKNEAETRAEVGDVSLNTATTLNLAGALSVNAASNTHLNSISVSGSFAGAIAGAGVANVALIDDTTVAGLYKVTVGQSAPVVAAVISDDPARAGDKLSTFDSSASGMLSSAPGSVSVTATQSVVDKVKSGAEAAGSLVGGGASANIVILGSTVAAESVSSTVASSGALTIHAASTKDVDALVISGGVASLGGLGAGASLILVGSAQQGDTPDDLASSMSTADKLGKDGGSRTDGASASLTADEKARVTAGASTSVGGTVAGSADGVTARVSGGALDAASVAVTASGLTSTSNITGTVAGGAVAMAGGVSYTRLYDNIAATVDNAAIVAPSVTLGASMADGSPTRAAGVAKAYGGSGSALAGVGGWAADVKVQNSVTARLGGTVSALGAGALVTIGASDTSSVKTSAVGVSAGALAVGAVLSYADKQSLVAASITEGASISGAANATLNASNSGSVDADATGSVGGALAGVGVDAKANDSSTVAATVGAPSSAHAAGAAPLATTFNLGAGSLTLNANATPDTGASAFGVAVGGISVGASLARASAATNVSALLLSNVDLKATNGALNINATNNRNGTGDSAKAYSLAGSGGILVGITATTADASSNVNVNAAVGEHVALPMGAVTIAAANNTQQTALTSGIAVGGIAAVGVDESSARSNSRVTATLGSGASTGLMRDSALTITAKGNDNNIADAKAGAGSLVAGAGASASTSSDAFTLAQIQGDGATAQLFASNVLVDAHHTAQYAGSADTISAGLIGGSGAIVSNRASSDVLADVGSSAVAADQHAPASAPGKVVLTAFGVDASDTPAIMVSALNQYVGPAEGFTSAQGAAGGGLNGAAAESKTYLDGSSAVTVAHDVTLYAGTDPFTNGGGIGLAAGSKVRSADQVTLTTGGLIQGAGTNSEIHLGSDGKPFTSSVTVGANAKLSTFGAVGVGTFSQVDLTARSLVSTYGLAAVGVAHGTISADVLQDVAIGDGANIFGFGNVNIAAGTESTRNNRGTSLSGDTVAEGYVRGLIAVPEARATTDLASTANLTIGSATINSAQDVNLAALHGTPSAQADGSGHGYQLGFIPVKDGTSDPSQSTASTVSIGGATIAAGVYNKLDIVIDDCNNSGIFCGTVGHTGAAPLSATLLPPGAFQYAYMPAFSPQTYVTNNFPENDAKILNAGVSSTDVGAVVFGKLWASGGNINVNGDTVTGKGGAAPTLRAKGNPTITVTNNSPDYLVIGDVEIPNVLGGQISFLGSSSAAMATGAHWSLDPLVNPAAQSDAKNIVIVNNYTKPVGTTANGVGPGMFLAGTLANLGGVVNLSAENGSFGSTGQIQAAVPVLTFPAGTVVMSTPGGTQILGASPLAEWATYMDWPGGNPATGTPDANQAIVWAANVKAGKLGFTGSDTNDLTRTLIGYADHGSLSTYTNSSGEKIPVSLIYYGACGFLQCDTSAERANQLSPNGGSINVSRDGGDYATIPVRALSKSSSSFASDAQTSTAIDPLTGKPVQSALIFGGQVAVTARYIDISGNISLGAPTRLSAGLDATLTAPVVSSPDFFGNTQYVGGAISLADLNYAAGTGKAIVDLAGVVARQGDKPMSVSYDAEHKQIIVNDTRAASSGAYLRLNGAIVSTNPNAEIKVNGGLGDVLVNNTTGLPVVVRNINAGAAIEAGSLVSQIEITDMAKDNASNHSLYRYTLGSGAGAGLRTYQGAGYIGGRLATIDDLLAAGVGTGVTGAHATYQPLNGLVYSWEMSAKLVRDTNSDANPWNWADSNYNAVVNSKNPWYYKDASGNLSQTPTARCIGVAESCGVTPLAPGEVFNESIGASSWYNRAVQVNYHGCDGGECHYGFRQNTSDGKGAAAGWVYAFMSNAEIDVHNVVRADNPFKISFSGSSNGSVVVNSNASIVLDGGIFNPSGATSLTATGNNASIGQASVNALSLKPVAAASSALVTNALTLNATGAVGSALAPLSATLTTGGVLNVSAGTAGIGLQLDSGALVGQVVAKGAGAQDFGDVVIVAKDDLQSIGSGVNVAGRNITLRSIDGAIGNATPLTIQATPAAGTALRNGVVDITANGDINVLQPSRDLLIDQIASTSGNVTVSAPGGSILNAEGISATSVVSQSDVEGFWRDLHLTVASDAANYAYTTSLTPLINAVNAHYKTYWKLVGQNGSVANGVFVNGVYQGTYTLSNAGLTNFRDAARASLDLAANAAITDNQVRAYADGLFKSTTAALTASLSPASLNASLNAAALADLTTTTSPASAHWTDLGVFTTYDARFNFKDLAKTQADYAASTNATWTESELTSVVRKKALEPDPGARPVGAYLKANIAGKQVTLNVAGAVGANGAGLVVDMDHLRNGTLTTAEKSALALAASPGDISLVWHDAANNLVTVDPSAQTPVWRNAQGVVLPVVAANGVPDGVMLYSLTVKQVAPLFVDASGAMNIASSGGTYLQSKSNVTVGSINAGGDVNIAAIQSIVAPGAGLPVDGVAIRTGGLLTLTSSTGDVGSDAANPISYSVSGTGNLNSVSAGNNAYLRQVGGDVTLVGGFYAANTGSIEARDGSIFTGENYNGLAIDANTIVLKAYKDIGKADRAVQVHNGLGGSVNAETLYGSVYLEDPKDKLVIGDIDAFGAVQVTASNNATIGHIDSGRGVTLNVAGVASTAADSVIHGRSVTFTGGALHMDAASSLTADRNVLITTTAGGPATTLGEVILGKVGSASTSGVGIEVNAAGYLQTLGAVYSPSSIAFTADGAMTFDGSVGTLGNLALRASGTSTQSHAITADSLLLSGNLGAYLFNTADNRINSLAARVSTLSLRNTGHLNLTSVTSTAGVHNAAATLNGVQATSGVTFDVRTDGAGNIGSLTQDQAVIAQNLNLLGAGGSYLLGLNGNSITSLQGQSGSITFGSSNGYAINGLAGSSAVTLNSARTVSETNGISTPLLTLRGPSAVFNLSTANNAVGQVQTDASGVNTLTFRGDGGVVMGATNASNGVYLSTRGKVTQSGAIRTPLLNLNGAAGFYDLSTQDNAIDRLQAVTGTVRLREDSGFLVDGVTVSSQLWLSTAGSDVTQSTRSIHAGVLDLNGAGGRYDLSNVLNVVNVLRAKTDTVSFASTQGYVLNGIQTSRRTTLQSEGVVGETAGVVSDTLELKSVSGTGSFLLQSQNNMVSMLKANVGALNFRDDQGFVINGMNVLNRLAISSQGRVNSTASMTAGSLLLAGANGIYSFDRYNNRFGSLTANAMTASILNNDNLTLGAMTIGDVLALRSSGTVTQGSEAIVARQVILNGLNGVYDFSAGANQVGSFSGNTNIVKYHGAAGASDPDITRLVVNQYVPL
jgi:filamentous hemagglutinin family protein